MKTTLIERIKQIKHRALQINMFMRRGLWDVDVSSLRLPRALIIRFLRVVMLVFKGFRDDECSMHASALTFSTLMAIVPVIALGLSMARGLGDADTARLWVQQRVEAWTEMFTVEGTTEAERTMDSSLSFELTQPASEDVNALAARINVLVEQLFEKVDNINFARLGTLGLVLLIWMVIEVLGRIERSFNRVWGVSKGRTVWRRFTDYLSVLLILPVLIVAAASLPVLEIITRFMPSGTADLLRTAVASGMFKNMVVLLMTTFAFMFVIMFMPNTAMQTRSGFAGGFVSAVLFLLWLWICAMLQVGAVRYSRIYGSFAVVPIVLAWVHVSWQIVLFGAEVAFSVENCDTFKMEQNAGDANVRARLTLALSLVAEAARSMLTENPPLDITRYGQQHKVPVRLLHAVVDQLVDAGWMAPLDHRPGVYVLLKAPAALTVHDLLRTVIEAGSGLDDLGLTDADDLIRKTVENVFSGVDQGLCGMTIEQLVA